MLRVKKIEAKEKAQIRIQSDIAGEDDNPCKNYARPGQYDCMYDCKSLSHPEYYASWKY